MATTHGILNPRAGAAHFTLDRVAPSPALAPWVDRYWLIRWDLAESPPFAQETLPHPCVNVVLGTHRPGVFGVGVNRFVAELEGRGWVVGVKFRPGAFFPFYGRDVSELTGAERSIASVFGEDGTELERRVHARNGDVSTVDLVERFLLARNVEADDNVALAGRIVDMARADPTIGRASTLAARASISTRSLERLFRRYVGVSPKWIIRRHRVHEACERVAAGAVACWSELAQDLGYFDQAHFIRDFKSQVGRTPAQYAEMCAPR